MKDEATLLPAAQYLRMSKGHQQYSIANQSDAIRRYADARGFEVVATYQDGGRSGLSLHGRAGLQQLIKDVEARDANFGVVLVFDVSRWGRFQDVDESAYYEYLCKRAGIRVEYCGELFENDGSALSAILKGLKRAMAAEYSRDLSAKVFAGQRRLIELGFRQGGSPGYGLRRQAVDKKGKVRILLENGDQKQLQNDRVVLVPGPPEEVATVKWIYQRYIAGQSEASLLAELNKSGRKTNWGRPFSKMGLTAILTNEKYVGTIVWNKRSSKLKTRSVRNGPEQWVRVPNAFAPIIDRRTFDAAQEMRKGKRSRLTRDEMLQRAKEVLSAHGTLSRSLIEEHEGPIVGRAIIHKFGGLAELYKRLGYTGRRDMSFVAADRLVRRMKPAVCQDVFQHLRANSKSFVLHSPDCVSVDGVSVAATLCRYRYGRGNNKGWYFEPSPEGLADLQIIARLNKQNTSVMDYVIMSTPALAAVKCRITETRIAQMNPQRCDGPSGLAGCVSKAAKETEGETCHTYARRSGRRTSVALRAYFYNVEAQAANAISLDQDGTNPQRIRSNRRLPPT